MNGIVERTRGTRRVTLGPGPTVTRTSGTFVPQTRTALGQAPVAPPREIPGRVVQPVRAVPVGVAAQGLFQRFRGLLLRPTTAGRPAPLLRPLITPRPIEGLERSVFGPARPGKPLPPALPRPAARALGQEFAEQFLVEEVAPFVPTAEILREAPVFFEEAVGGEVLLAQGDRGDAVQNLQLQLRRLGFPTGVVDGIYGPLTQQAVRLFQESVGLPGTGAVDQATWSLLQSGTSATAGAVSGPVAPLPVPEILREREEAPAARARGSASLRAWSPNPRRCRRRSPRCSMRWRMPSWSSTAASGSCTPTTRSARWSGGRARS